MNLFIKQYYEEKELCFRRDIGHQGALRPSSQPFIYIYKRIFQITEIEELKKKTISINYKTYNLKTSNFYVQNASTFTEKCLFFQLYLAISCVPCEQSGTGSCLEFKYPENVCHIIYPRDSSGILKSGISQDYRQNLNIKFQVILRILVNVPLKKVFLLREVGF